MDSIPELPSLSGNPADKLPLVVDLDGTLIRSDTLMEAAVQLAKSNPLDFFSIPYWYVAGGRSRVKQEIAKRTTLNPATLPYHTAFLAYLRSERARGRDIILATAADEKIAKSVAEHLDIFSRVIASDGIKNLSGKTKARALQEILEGPFVYAGNARSDMHVWKHAAHAIAVNAPRALVRALRKSAIRHDVYDDAMSPFLAVWNIMRPHQWAKNLLLFVPIVMAHQVTNVTLVVQTLLAFAAFCLCSSSVYVFNDLLDVQADREHPRKKYRPMATGHLSHVTSLLLGTLLLTASILVSLELPTSFLQALGLYFFLTLVYSYTIKGIAILDVILLAGLYTMRIIAGTGASGVPYSPWLLSFSLFLFLSLALMKRYVELDLQPDRDAPIGRMYRQSDKLLIGQLGTASGYLSVFVLTLYLNSPDVLLLYRHPSVLWLVSALVLYWISRMWFLASRQLIHDDPVLATLKDPQSYAIGCLSLVLLVLAS